MSQFTLKINLGSDAMTNGTHIAKALSEIGKSVYGLYYENIGTGTIKDVNGNTVGYWKVE